MELYRQHFRKTGFKTKLFSIYLTVQKEMRRPFRKSEVETGWIIFDDGDQNVRVIHNII